jgi:isoleucyl-tRNA synthetase
VLSIRETRQIRVRQPLPRLIAVAHDESRETLRTFEAHILDELNIKNLEFTDSLDGFVTYSIKPNNKTLGPKYGKDLRTITQLLTEGDPQVYAAAVSNNQNITLQSGDSQWQLEPTDLVVEKEFDEHLVVTDSERPPLIVDIKLNDELLREGYARDIVRHIQQTRKDSGLEIQDRINIKYHCPDESLNAAIDTHHDYICSETLCQQMIPADQLAPDNSREIKIAGKAISLLLEKA